ncbi:MAG TPA: SDR family oxidoreductase [Bryobacteraceae bacterium]|nr:SDR family oxidoreductase [Bryobacteraceae bacterium]
MSTAGPKTEIRDFSALQAGDKVSITRTITEQDLDAFAAATGDYNPLHMEAEFAETTTFQRRVVHGMLVASYVSTLVGMHLPGPGALWTQQSFRWVAPVFLQDTLEITLEVRHKSEGTRTVSLAVKAQNQHGKTVMEGEGSALLLERRETGKDRPIAKRVALVSGAGRGIGAAAARALAEAGAAVIVNYRNSMDEANALCKAIQAGGGRALSWQADVADATAVEAMISRASEHFGRPVDVVVNNAGLASLPRPFADLSWDDMQRQIDVHLRGAFNCIKAALPGMLAQSSGRIVNIGSAQTWAVPPPQWSSFIAAKTALHGFTRALASELGPSGIRVNMVSPGMTETSSLSGVPERLRKVQAMQTPLRRLARPDDVAKAIIFLCSEQGDFMTGVDLPVCGGSVM